MCWHIECSTFTASSFRIWNSSTGILSPPLALFIVMLPMAHLTLHSRMSGSRWVITPSWLSGSWRSFLYSSSVYSCHLFLISSVSVRSIRFLSFTVPIFVHFLSFQPLWRMVTSESRQKGNYFLVCGVFLRLWQSERVNADKQQSPTEWHKELYWVCWSQP